MTNLFETYNNSITKTYIKLESLDDILEYTESEDSIMLTAGYNLTINAMLHNSPEDEGLSYIEGSIRKDDRTIVYYGFDHTTKKTAPRAYDFIVVQKDEDEVTIITVYRKGTQEYFREIARALEGR